MVKPIVIGSVAGTGVAHVPASDKPVVRMSWWRRIFVTLTGLRQGQGKLCIGRQALRFRQPHLSTHNFAAEWDVHDALR